MPAPKPTPTIGPELNLLRSTSSGMPTTMIVGSTVIAAAIAAVIIAAVAYFIGVSK